MINIQTKFYIQTSKRVIDSNRHNCRAILLRELFKCHYISVNTFVDNNVLFFQLIQLFVESVLLCGLEADDCEVLCLHLIICLFKPQLYALLY